MSDHKRSVYIDGLTHVHILHIATLAEGEWYGGVVASGGTSLGGVQTLAGWMRPSTLGSPSVPVATAKRRS